MAAHALALFLILVGPIWDYFETRPLKKNPSRQARLTYYRQTILWLWIATGVACWAQGLGTLLTLRGNGIDAMWLDTHTWSRWLLAAVVALIVMLQLVLPVVQVSIKYGKRPYIEPRQLETLRFFLPSSRLERRWFAALSLTAGFCEELLFRGFLLRYLHTWPLHLPFLWTALAAAAIFGAHHLYQGAKGFVSTAIGGLIFTAMLLLTGSLWTGMAYHAAADVSLLLYWRPKPPKIATS
jgi:uncharacterized protein